MYHCNIPACYFYNTLKKESCSLDWVKLLLYLCNVILVSTFSNLYYKCLHLPLPQIVKKAVENKVFENETIDGYTVVAIDGIRCFGSDKKSCLECLKNIKG